MSLLMLAVVLPWLIVGFGCWVGYQLVRQNGRVLLRLEALETHLAHLVAPAAIEGLAVGSEAPPFELPTLHGGRMSLQQFQGQRVLLVFFSPYCGFCEEMAPALAILPWDGSDGRPVPVVVTTADIEENRALVMQAGIGCPVLLDENNEVAQAYRYEGTPSGYLIDEQGRIASELTVGAADLLMVARGPVAVEPERDGHATAGSSGNDEARIASHLTEHDARGESAALRREIRLPMRMIPAEGLGVGDLLKRVTDTVGLKTCRGCERRRHALNAWVIKGAGEKGGS